MFTRCHRPGSLAEVDEPGALSLSEHALIGASRVHAAQITGPGALDGARVPLCATLWLTACVALVVIDDAVFA